MPGDGGKEGLGEVESALSSSRSSFPTRSVRRQRKGCEDRKHLDQKEDQKKLYFLSVDPCMGVFHGRRVRNKNIFSKDINGQGSICCCSKLFL